MGGRFLWGSKGLREGTQKKKRSQRVATHRGSKALKRWLIFSTGLMTLGVVGTWIFLAQPLRGPAPKVEEVLQEVREGRVSLFSEGRVVPLKPFLVNLPRPSRAETFRN